MAFVDNRDPHTHPVQLTHWGKGKLIYYRITNQTEENYGELRSSANKQGLIYDSSRYYHRILVSFWSFGRADASDNYLLI